MLRIERRVKLHRRIVTVRWVGALDECIVEVPECIEAHNILTSHRLKLNPYNTGLVRSCTSGFQESLERTFGQSQRLMNSQ